VGGKCPHLIVYSSPPGADRAADCTVKMPDVRVARKSHNNPNLIYHVPLKFPTIIAKNVTGIFKNFIR
jgi:hypothetical protein